MLSSRNLLLLRGPLLFSNQHFRKSTKNIKYFQVQNKNDFIKRWIGQVGDQITLLPFSSIGGIRFLHSNDGRRKILFSCSAQGKLKMMSGLSLFHGFNWVALTVYSNQNPVVIPEGSSSYVSWLSSPLWNNLGLALSLSFVYFMHIFSKKYVAEISMIPGSSHLDCHCYTFFGNKGEARSLPIGSVELSSESGSYLPIKPKGDQVFLLLDLNKGTFHDKPALLALLSGKKDPCVEEYLRLPLRDTSSRKRKKKTRK